MSFDIFLHAFGSGQPIPRALIADAIEPYLAANEQTISTKDGSAEVFGLAGSTELDGLTFTHVSGLEAWEVIYQVALAANWVILPTGCPVCVVDQAQIQTLPEDLLESVGATVVSSGADVLEVIAKA